MATLSPCPGLDRSSYNGTAPRYKHLDDAGVTIKRSQAEAKDFEEALQAKINHFLLGDKDFIYKNDIANVWSDYVAAQQGHDNCAGTSC